MMPKRGCVTSAVRTVSRTFKSLPCCRTEASTVCAGAVIACTLADDCGAPVPATACTAASASDESCTGVAMDFWGDTLVAMDCGDDALLESGADPVDPATGEFERGVTAWFCMSLAD